MLHKIAFSRELRQTVPPSTLVITDADTLQAASRANSWVSSYPSQLMQPHVSQASPMPLQSVYQPQKLILVIDDSLTVRKILETCLNRAGFRVKSFCDGVEAMRWLAQSQGIPDLVWLDIGLPKMDGYEVARHFKAKPGFSHTPIVMLSRRDGVIDRLKGRLAGARDYLTKPFKTQDIVSVTEFYLGPALSEQETLHQPSVQNVVIA